MSVLYKTELEVRQNCKYFSPQKTNVEVSLNIDQSIHIHSSIVKATIYKKPGNKFVIYGKGAKIHKALIDKTLDMFFEKLKSEGIAYSI